MPLNEAGARAKLIDPALHARGWSEDLMRRGRPPARWEYSAVTVCLDNKKHARRTWQVE